MPSPLKLPTELTTTRISVSATTWVTLPLVHPAHLLQYAAFLARSLKPSSISSYLNIIGILHKEFGLPNPLLDNWPLKSLLTGIKRAIGMPPNQKLPITPSLLLRLHATLNFTKSFDSSFWAICLVAFYSLFHKSHLLPMSAQKFDSSKHSPKAISSFFPGVHSSPFDGAKPFSSGKGWLISPFLASLGASYALPQLLYMPFILLIPLQLIVKRSPGKTTLYPLKLTSSPIICSFLNYGTTSQAWASMPSHTRGTHSVEAGRLLHTNQGYH